MNKLIPAAAIICAPALLLTLSLVCRPNSGETPAVSKAEVSTVQSHSELAYSPKPQRLISHESVDYLSSSVYSELYFDYYPLAIYENHPLNPDIPLPRGRVIPFVVRGYESRDTRKARFTLETYGHGIFTFTESGAPCLLSTLTAVPCRFYGYINPEDEETVWSIFSLYITPESVTYHVDYINGELSYQ